MFDILLYNYYHRYKQTRQVIKNLVQNDDIAEAISRLDSIVQEHDNYINSNGIVNEGETFTSVDNMSLHHAKLHLDAFNETGQISQKDRTIRALNEE